MRVALDNGLRVALVHGFTQAAGSWTPVQARLEEAGHTVVTPEASGHGAQSDRRDALPADAERLADEVGGAVWVGYSMGGRLCLHVAVQRPEVVRGLVLVSTTAGIEDDAERAERRAADEELARSIEADGVAAFVDRWLAGPLWATLPRAAAGVEIRRANTPAGLAASLRLAGTGAQAPLWDRLSEIAAPVLIVTGSLDAKFSALGTRLAGALRSAAVTVEQIEGAGHALPWERPDELAEAVHRWMLSQEPGPR